jgi:hypothetical protein
MSAVVLPPLALLADSSMRLVPGVTAFLANYVNGADPVINNP